MINQMTRTHVCTTGFGHVDNLEALRVCVSDMIGFMGLKKIIPLTGSSRKQFSVALKIMSGSVRNQVWLFERIPKLFFLKAYGCNLIISPQTHTHTLF